MLKLKLIQVSKRGHSPCEEGMHAKKRNLIWHHFSATPSAYGISAAPSAKQRAFSSNIEGAQKTPSLNFQQPKQYH